MRITSTSDLEDDSQNYLGLLNPSMIKDFNSDNYWTWWQTSLEAPRWHLYNFTARHYNYKDPDPLHDIRLSFFLNNNPRDRKVIINFSQSTVLSNGVYFIHPPFARDYYLKLDYGISSVWIDYFSLESNLNSFLWEFEHQNNGYYLIKNQNLPQYLHAFELEGEDWIDTRDWKFGEPDEPINQFYWIIYGTGLDSFVLKNLATEAYFDTNVCKAPNSFDIVSCNLRTALKLKKADNLTSVKVSESQRNVYLSIYEEYYLV